MNNNNNIYLLLRTYFVPDFALSTLHLTDMFIPNINHCSSVIVIINNIDNSINNNGRNNNNNVCTQNYSTMSNLTKPY